MTIDRYRNNDMRVTRRGLINSKGKDSFGLPSYRELGLDRAELKITLHEKKKRINGSLNQSQRDNELLRRVLNATLQFSFAPPQSYIKCDLSSFHGSVLLCHPFALHAFPISLFIGTQNHIGSRVVIKRAGCAPSSQRALLIDR